MSTFQELRTVATSALHTTVRIHRKNGKFQIYKNGAQVCDTSDWNTAKEIALSHSSSSKPNRTT